MGSRLAWKQANLNAAIRGQPRDVTVELNHNFQVAIIFFAHYFCLLIILSGNYYSGKAFSLKLKQKTQTKPNKKKKGKEKKKEWHM